MTGGTADARQSANSATGAPTAGAGARNKPPKVGNCSNCAADFPSRSYVTYMCPSAKAGMVGPGTGKDSFISSLPSGEKQLTQAADGPADQ